MANLTVDSSAWPVTIITAEGKADTAAAEKLVDTIVEIAKRKQPFVNILDFRKLTDLNAAVRNRYTERSKETEALWRAHFAGAVIISGSAIMRGAMTAISWFMDLGAIKIVGSMAEAERDAKALLAVVGVSWPGLPQPQ